MFGVEKFRQKIFAHHRVAKNFRVQEFHCVANLKRRIEWKPDSRFRTSLAPTLDHPSRLRTTFIVSVFLLAARAETLDNNRNRLEFVKDRR
jgi:hypothetical protein